MGQIKQWMVMGLLKIKYTNPAMTSKNLTAFPTLPRTTSILHVLPAATAVVCRPHVPLLQRSVKQGDLNLVTLTQRENMHIKDQKSPNKKASNVKQSPSKRSFSVLIELFHIILMPYQLLLALALFDVQASLNSRVIGVLMRGVGTL